MNSKKNSEEKSQQELLGHAGLLELFDSPCHSSLDQVWRHQLILVYSHGYCFDEILVSNV